MPTGVPKTTVTAAVSPDTKERLKRIAAEKRWTVSQTLAAFIDDYLEVWENDLGIEKTDAATPPKP